MIPIPDQLKDPPPPQRRRALHEQHLEENSRNSSSNNGSTSTSSSGSSSNSTSHQQRKRQRGEQRKQQQAKPHLQVRYFGSGIVSGQLPSRDLYTTPLTEDDTNDCCPHLEAYLPKFLDSDISSILWRDNPNSNNDTKNSSRSTRSTRNISSSSEKIAANGGDKSTVITAEIMNELIQKWKGGPTSISDVHFESLFKGPNGLNNIALPQTQSPSALSNNSANNDSNDNRNESKRTTDAKSEGIATTGDPRTHLLENTDNVEDPSYVKKSEKTIRMALTKVEQWLEVIRQNRLRFWKLRKMEQGGHEEGGDVSSTLCSTTFGSINAESREEKMGLTCKYCVLYEKKKENIRRKKKKNKNINSNTCSQNRNDIPIYRCNGSDDDDILMQCLDCSLVACGPSTDSTKSATSRQHLLQHFLISGHSLGISCGPKARIYCAKCADFVNNPILDREKERIDIKVNAEWFGWERNGVTRRSFGFSHHPIDDFVYIPDGPSLVSDDDKNIIGVTDTSSQATQSKIEDVGCGAMIVWRGFRALYPTGVPYELIEAGRMTCQRLKMFHEKVNNTSAIQGGQLQKQAARHSTCGSSQSRPTVPRPVGLYNMGNTCYLGCVLQCLMNLSPIQEYFLHQVKHDHLSCKILRSVKREKGTKKETSSSVTTSCIGCETDKLFLEYYGSGNGIDMSASFQGNDESCSVKDTKSSDKTGLPVAPTNMLVELWKCQSMSLLAGYEQRDAHEFLQVFLDILSKDCREYHSIAKGLRNKVKSKHTNFRPNNTVDEESGDIVSSLFGGLLRSVLICEQCGFKRAQKEVFLNISIPLDKELTSVDHNVTAQGSTTRRKTSMRNKIDLKACLEKFVSPETLCDPLECNWCKEKTSTLKQHTFAKLPKVLCLHLKRFDAARNRKIDEPVSFPKQLNMGPYFPHWREVQQKDVILKKQSSEQKVADPAFSSDLNTCPEMLYDLCATIDHSGTLYQGHYISNVKIENQWYHCNDSFISKSSEQEVLRSNEVYMMFYIRR